MRSVKSPSTELPEVTIALAARDPVVIASMDGFENLPLVLPMFNAKKT
jgi:hypothetical protein